MEAAKLVHVQDRLDLGVDALVAGSEKTGKTVASEIPSGGQPSTPTPTPARNSGTELGFPSGSEVQNGEARNFGGARATGSAPTQTKEGISTGLLIPSFDAGMSGDGSLYAKKVASVVPQPDPQGGDFEPRG